MDGKKIVEYHVRVEDANEKLVGHLVGEREKREALPRIFRDPATGKYYEAQLDDFCCLASYREMAIPDLKVEPEGVVDVLAKLAPAPASN